MNSDILFFFAERTDALPVYEKPESQILARIPDVTVKVATPPKKSICGIKVELIEDPLMQEIRHLDRLVDKLAKGKAMEKILRK